MSPLVPVPPTVLILAVLWIAVCSYASFEWWQIRRRAVAVRVAFELDPDTHPDNLQLARSRATASTFWFLAGVLGSVVGLLAIVDRGPGLRTTLLFAGPIILALMGHEQDRNERALIVRAVDEMSTDAALREIAAQLSPEDATSLRAVVDRLEKAVARIEASDVLVAADLKQAQRAVDDLATDVAESRERADAVGDADPGEAADAWSQSGED